jgi:hypothetical protein
LEGDLRRGGKEEEGIKLIFKIPLNGRKRLATRRARGNLFSGMPKHGLQEIAVGVN